MGCYVNPPSEGKVAFLAREGLEVPVPPVWDKVPAGSLPVVLVDNGPFTAAGVAFCESELRAFTDPSDRRPKRYFIVPIEKLLPVSDLADYQEKE